jgi:ring-1,2-phenylacetyl-CoA epoxidase subunit PaaD
VVTYLSAYAAAASVADPELPAVTIEDLGILRSVAQGGDGRVTVTITPTYSGCPAMDAIRSDVADALSRAGFADVSVVTALSPAWTTDMITPAGRDKLEAAGIAPPGPVLLQIGVRCVHCGSSRTEELSRFSSTACKALWRCRDCGEPFERVKPL